MFKKLGSIIILAGILGITGCSSRSDNQLCLFDKQLIQQIDGYHLDIDKNVVLLKSSDYIQADQGYLVTISKGIDGVVYIPAQYNEQPVLGFADDCLSNQKIICYLDDSISSSFKLPSADGYAYVYYKNQLIDWTAAETCFNAGYLPMFTSDKLCLSDDSKTVIAANLCTSRMDESTQKICIPNGVETIGENAFAYISVPYTVSLPDTIQTIGPCAFYKSLLSDINFPESLRCIKDKAFEGCQYLEGKIQIPEGVTISSISF